MEYFSHIEVYLVKQLPFTMKLCILILGNLLYAITSFSQTTKSRIIKGIILDSLKNQPISYATVTLQDSSSVPEAGKNTLSNELGSFELSATSGKVYKLIIASIGYRGKSIYLNTTDDKLITILLSPSNNQLNEVVVTGSKPIVKQEVDRITYDVQNDPDNSTTTVMQMLRKVPLVSVDAADNIRLKGSENFKILLNGKESGMITRNPSDVFKGMPASNIQKIEVITTPPAKYDAEGLAGIINIITKRNVDQGYKGSFSTRMNSVEGPGINLNATYKQGKFSIGGFLGYNNTIKQTTAFENSNNIIRPIIINLLQQGMNTKSGNRAYGSAELSYEIDTLNLLAGNFQTFEGNINQTNNQYTTAFIGTAQTETNYEHLLNRELANTSGFDLGLNYQLGFKNTKNKFLTASYRYLSSLNNQDIAVNYLLNTNFRNTNFKQFDNSGKKEQTIQLDYIHTIKGIAIEAGTKAIFRRNFSDFETLKLGANSSDFVLDDLQSNSFDFRQQIVSLYNSYQYKSKKWTGKAGLRLEVTKIAVEFTSTTPPIQPDYNNLVPSFSLQRVLNETNSLTFGYTDRIRRPTIRHLNPFVNKVNPKFVSVGNPNLAPVVNHSVELNYSNFKKGSINIGLNYSFSSNTIENLLTVSADTITTNTFQNIGKNKRLGLDFNMDYPITEKFNITINTQVLNAWLNGSYDGKLYNNRGLQGHLFVDNSYAFDKGLNVGLNIGYESRYVLLQGKDYDFFFYTFNASRELFKKKATLSLEMTNPLNKFRTIDFYNRTSDFSQANNSQMFAREFAFSFNYKFGKLKGGVKKSKRSISSDDAGGSRK